MKWKNLLSTWFSLLVFHLDFVFRLVETYYISSIITMSSQKYQASEVAKHNHPEDLWFVLHGKVYDITKFLKEHPGGEEVLIHLAGTDASQCFDDIGHSQEAKQLKDTYEIGTLEGTMASLTTTTGKSDAKAADDDDWEYVEVKKESSSYMPVFIGLGVLVYAVVFYYIFY